MGGIEVTERLRVDLVKSALHRYQCAVGRLMSPFLKHTAQHEAPELAGAAATP
jgi:hypothetical protein